LNLNVHRDRYTDRKGGMVDGHKREDAPSILEGTKIRDAFFCTSL